MNGMTLVGDEDLAAWRRDAKRYRAMRNLNWHDSKHCLVSKPRDNVKLGSDCPSGERFDAVADALIEEQQNEQ